MRGYVDFKECSHYGRGFVARHFVRGKSVYTVIYSKDSKIKNMEIFGTFFVESLDVEPLKGKILHFLELI